MEDMPQIDIVKTGLEDEKLPEECVCSPSGTPDTEGIQISAMPSYNLILS